LDLQLRRRALIGYAVGLDTPASAAAISRALSANGFDIQDINAEALIADLSRGPEQAVLSVAEYPRAFARLPEAFRQSIVDAWGDPADDPSARDGAFVFRFARSGKLIVAVQPEQTTPATAIAQHLREQLTSLTAALETLPLGRKSSTVDGSGSSAQTAAREVHLAVPAPAHVHRDRLAPTHDTKGVRTAGRSF